jgi:transcriptional regulator with PAS, ATPase and Fis domain
MAQIADAELLGTSEPIADLKAEAVRVARTDAKVLITGESGTGKDLVASVITAASKRAHLPFVPVNCAGIPETLLESELFGHVKGSFTGAYRDKPGKLEMANNGTVFLDEIGEMTLRMQGLLLRFVETGELQKVGAERLAVADNVRILAATNRNLRQLVAEGLFRADLFYRLDVIHLVVPPLRDRREDIPLLIDHFMRRFTTANHHDGKGNGTPGGIGNRHGNGQDDGNEFVVRDFSPEAVAALCRYSWPGNVRELQNVVERLVVTGNRETVTVDDLDPEIRTPLLNGGQPKHERRKTVADELLKKLLERHESFWTAVYPLYLDHEITRGNVRDVVHKGLKRAGGNYKILVRLFNIEPAEYKRFLNFLHKHRCHLPFKEYRL